MTVEQAVADAVAAEKDRIIEAAARSGSYDSAGVFRVLTRAYPDEGLTAVAWRRLSAGESLATLRGLGVLTRRQRQAQPPDRMTLVEVKPPEPDDQEEDERGPCECDHCGLGDCDGECAACDDHGCTQCWPEGCPSDEVSSCCGYCDHCDRHVPDFDVDTDYVCSLNHCHDCDHSC